jgi:3-phenylpropionate/trans-cinnamate dioxygenase ferredoxin reductase component
MSQTDFDIVIVGAGHGGAQAAIALRQQGFSGSIALVGAEPDLPYQRPPLTKQYLAQTSSFEQIQLRPASFWDTQNVSLISGSRVVALDVKRRIVNLENGRRLTYRKLVWSAGGRPRQLSCVGHSLYGVHSIRTRSDVDRLLVALRDARQIVVIGGGYIGLEAAATLIKFGKAVTVLETCDRVLARVAGEPLSRFYEAHHRSQGVDVRLNSSVTCIEDAGGRVAGVRLATGAVVPADLVIVGIGIIPEIETLEHAGVRVSNGVEVDSSCQTSAVDVFAIGDCARHVNPFADHGPIRLESVQNAADQASTVAKAITGSVAHYNAVPWFWSEQYDLRLQTVGLSLGYDDLVVRGDPSRQRFSVAYLRNKVLIALDCVNAPADFVQGKTLIQQKCSPDRSALQDVSVPLKSLRD